MASFEEFNKYFKKREQVFIGFQEGSSHGYVSKFNKQGIYLIQINHAKEYFYTWNQCEVICHAGYLIKQVGQSEVAKLIMISLERQESNVIQLGSKEKKTDGNSLKLLKDFIKEKFNFSISVREAKKSMEEHFPDLWELYISSLFDFASEITPNSKKDFEERNNRFFLHDFNINPSKLKWRRKKSGVADELRINGNCVTGLIELSYQGMACQLRNDTIERVMVQSPALDGGLGGYGEHIQIIKPVSDNKQELWKPLSITEENINMILKTTKENLKKFIEDFRYIYSGDPYELSGKPISSSVFQSSQGFCLLNPHAELYATV